MRRFNGFEDMADLARERTSLAAQERCRGPLLCPKPRRLAIINHAISGDAVRPLWLPLSHPTEQLESKAGSELFDIIFAKGVYGGDQSGCGSPPYFCGSPPSRAANPLIHDVRFTEGRRDDLPPVPFPVPAGFSASPASSPHSSPSPSSARKGCARAKFGHKPAAVRIEGFDSLDRDRRGCGIPAMA